MLQRLGVANPKRILQRFLEKRCPKLYPRKHLQRLPTKKSVAISVIATISGLLQHFLGVETGSKFSSAAGWYANPAMVGTLSPPDGVSARCRWLHHHHRMVRRPSVDGCNITTRWYAGRRRWLHHHRRTERRPDVDGGIIIAGRYAKPASMDASMLVVLNDNIRLPNNIQTRRKKQTFDTYAFTIDIFPHVLDT